MRSLWIFAVVIVGNVASESFFSTCCHERHCCAVQHNRAVKCWGHNHNGQLGLGHTDDRGGFGGEPEAIDLGSEHQAERVACGGHHTCVLLVGGLVKCFGHNANGQLGIGDTLDRGQLPNQMGNNLPTVDFGVGQAAAFIACGVYHSCAVLTSGDLKCWGKNYAGQLGQGDTLDRGDASAEMGSHLPAALLDGKVECVACGEHHTCALLQGGAVKCFGYNQQGQLGYGDTAYRGVRQSEMGSTLPAVSLTDTNKVASLSCGGQHCCAVTGGGLKCWGSNMFDGRLGYGDTHHRGDEEGEMGHNLPFVDLGAGFTAASVSCGWYHTCVLSTSGEVKCFGKNDSGQLGLGDSTNRGSVAGLMGHNLPVVDLGTGTAVLWLVLGGYHSCAVLDTGEMVCWGRNDKGQLGIGDTMNRGDREGEMGNSLSAVESVEVLIPACFDCPVETESNECELGTHNCSEGWTCRDLPALFECEEVDASSGEEPDACSDRTHTCHEDAACIATSPPGSFECHCLPGFLQVAAGMEGDCADVDECETAIVPPCQSTEICVNSEGSFICVSVEDKCYAGTHNCDPNAQCTASGLSFDCKCRDGFASRRGSGEVGDCLDMDECELEIDNCNTDAVCTNTPGSFTCTCKEGFSARGDGSGDDCWRSTDNSPPFVVLASVWLPESGCLLELGAPRNHTQCSGVAVPYCVGLVQQLITRDQPADCDAHLHCKHLHSIRAGSQQLFRLNLADLILEAVGVVLLLCIACRLCLPSCLDPAVLWVAAEGVLAVAAVGVTSTELHWVFHTDLSESMDGQDGLHSQHCVERDSDHIIKTISDELQDMRWLAIFELLLAVAEVLYALVACYCRSRSSQPVSQNATPTSTAPAAPPGNVSPLPPAPQAGFGQFAAEGQPEGECNLKVDWLQLFGGGLSVVQLLLSCADFALTRSMLSDVESLMESASSVADSAWCIPARSRC